MSIQRFDKVTIEPPKTYAETQGKAPFDWRQFLERAKSGCIALNGMEHQLAAERALGWTTCACGNQCSVIPREENGEPIDWYLSNLGADFYDYVRAAKWSDASEVLLEIEVRSAELIAELTPALELHP